MTVLTEKEYVEMKGTKCPACGSIELEGRSINIDGGTATQGMSCLDCCATWEDVYKLSGYDLLEKGDGE